jgi:glutamate-ammonia-ligase adenylyltransferase
VVFRVEPLPDAIAGVRAALDKIDRRERARGGGFDVKLGAGGIREIEFVAQALQLAYGGQDPWIRSPQVLIGLQRLADKGFLSDSDRSVLSDAYTFLRTVEHRLQMTHGAQTHRLPVDPADLAALARRCDYDPQEGEPGARLAADVEAHTSRVRAIAERVFALGDRAPEVPPLLAPERGAAREAQLGPHSAEAIRPLEASAALLGQLAGAGGDAAERTAEFRGLLVDIASRLPHPARALRNLERYLASLAKADDPAAPARVLAGGAERLDQLVRLLGSGAFFAEILVARPDLAAAIPGSLFCTVTRTREELLASLSAAVDAETSLAGRMAALRRAWYREIVAVGAHDLLGGCSLRATNREQTALAEAALEVAHGIALRELAPEREPRSSVFALGRLGHAGMDYGSDLDLLMVFDGDAPAPSGAEEASLFHARFAQLLVRVLSSLTREGYVYRVDFRLRPEGRSGRMASSLTRMLEYVATRAGAWELSAYLKVRHAAGDAAFGAEARAAVIAAVFDAAARREALGDELRAMRLGLEREQGRGGRNIKWGPGGMMDVYFATRYAQLATRTDFPPELGTRALIEHLGRAGVFDAAVARDLYEGYTLLRRVDHVLRLVDDRQLPTLPEEPDLLEEVAAAVGFDSPAAFGAALAASMASIRAAFDRTFSA